MADVHEPNIRSYNMSQIKSKDTEPELIVRKFLHAKGFRYRLHDKKLPGKPDLVFPKYKTVIFIQGCFWHGHDNCKYFRIPKTNTTWWKNKINNNKERDLRNQRKLQQRGWRVLLIFECELKSSKRNNTLFRVVNELRSMS